MEYPTSHLNFLGIKKGVYQEKTSDKYAISRESVAQLFLYRAIKNTLAGVRSQRMMGSLGVISCFLIGCVSYGLV